MASREWYARMKEHTAEHVKDPQPGDHFTEMCGSVAYIVSRNGGMVTLQRTNTNGGHKGWGREETIPVYEFIKWASYGSGTPGYWLSLYPPTMPAQMLEGG